MIIELDRDQADLILTVLNIEWSRLDQIRGGMTPPDDQPILERQQDIGDVQQLIREGL